MLFRIMAKYGKIAIFSIAFLALLFSSKGTYAVNSSVILGPDPRGGSGSLHTNLLSSCNNKLTNGKKSRSWSSSIFYSGEIKPNKIINNDFVGTIELDPNDLPDSIDVYIFSASISCSGSFNNDDMHDTNIRFGDWKKSTTPYDAKLFSGLKQYSERGQGLVSHMGTFDREGQFTSIETIINNKITFKFHPKKFDFKSHPNGTIIGVPIFSCNAGPIGYNVDPSEEIRRENDKPYPGCLSSVRNLRIKIKNQWQVNAKTRIQKKGELNWRKSSSPLEIFRPGEEVEFMHEFWTPVKHSTGQGISYSIGENWSLNRTSNAGNSDLRYGYVPQRLTSENIPLYIRIFSYKVTEKDRGKTICQSIRVWNAHKDMFVLENSDQFKDGENAVKTTPACFYVPYDTDTYIPIVPVDGKCLADSCDKEEEPGVPDVGIPTNIITPDDGNVPPIDWKLTYFVVKPDNYVPGKNTKPKTATNGELDGGFISSDSEPCRSDFYNRSNAVYQANEENAQKKILRCQVIENGTLKDLKGKVQIRAKVFGKLNKFDIPEDAEIGTKYCFALSISPYMMDSSWTKERQAEFKDWYHGKPGCVVVVKKPKTQILGAGLYSGGFNVKGETSSRSGRLYGSWVEYEIVARGLVSKVASNGTFGYPNGATGFLGGTNSGDVQSRLTFKNYPKPYGLFFRTEFNQSKNFFERMKSIYGSQNATSSGSNLNIHVPDKYSLIKPNGDATINSITAKDKNIVIYAPDKTVNIDGDIIQEAGDRSSKDISQVIIIAKKINISGNVNRIDAWLMAGEEINTCYKYDGKIVSASDLTNSVCNNKLEVNGPVVIAKDGESLKLRRTAGSIGSGDGIGLPAEQFSTNAETYEWIIQDTLRNSGKITTTYTKELPVRY